MKITMSRRDEILKRKQEYEDTLEKRNQENLEYNKTIALKMDALGKIIQKEIGKTSLPLRIMCSVGGIFTGIIRVTIDNGDNANDHSQALKWSWEVLLKEDGTLEKDSSSWSGLQAVSVEQLDNLKESIRVLEILNNIDWASILNVKIPEYKDYVKTKAPEWVDFEEELFEEDLNDAILNGYLIKGRGYKYYRQSTPVYYKVVGETPKNYTVYEIYEGDASNQSKWLDSYRISKQTFMNNVVKKPLETLEV